MKTLTLLGLLLLLLAFAMALMETANVGPTFPVVSFLYAMLILTFFVGIFGLLTNIINYMVSRRVYVVFMMFMSLCTVPMMIVHYMVPVHYRFSAINDVSTDSVEVPQFYNSLSSRRIISRQQPHVDFFKIQHKITLHPYLGTTHFSSSCQRISRLVISSLSYRGWPINFSAITDSTIEASASFFFANYSSDMVIRMIDSPKGGCSVDVRSSSRDDFIDWGHNILLIDRFIDTLKKICHSQGVV